MVIKQPMRCGKMRCGNIRRCGGRRRPTPPGPTVIPVESIDELITSLSQEEGVGATYALNYTPINANDFSSVNIYSNDPGIASCSWSTDGNGVLSISVQCVAEGQTTIVGTRDGYVFFELSVTVTPSGPTVIPVESIDSLSGSFNGMEGDSTICTVNYTPTNANYFGNVYTYSNDPGIATCYWTTDGNGTLIITIYCISEGTTTLIGTIDDVQFFNYNVVVDPAPQPEPFVPENSILVTPLRGNARVQFFTSDPEEGNYIQANLDNEGHLNEFEYFGECDNQVFYNFMSEDMITMLGDMIELSGHTGQLQFNQESWGVIESYFENPEEVSIESVVEELDPMTEGGGFIEDYFRITGLSEESVTIGGTGTVMFYYTPSDANIEGKVSFEFPEGVRVSLSGNYSDGEGYIDIIGDVVGEYQGWVRDGFNQYSLFIEVIEDEPGISIEMISGENVSLGEPIEFDVVGGNYDRVGFNDVSGCLDTASATWEEGPDSWRLSIPTMYAGEATIDFYDLEDPGIGYGSFSVHIEEDVPEVPSLYIDLDASTYDGGDDYYPLYNIMDAGLAELVQTIPDGEGGEVHILPIDDSTNGTHIEIPGYTATEVCPESGDEIEYMVEGSGTIIINGVGTINVYDLEEPTDHIDIDGHTELSVTGGRASSLTYVIINEDNSSSISMSGALGEDPSSLCPDIPPTPEECLVSFSCNNNAYGSISDTNSQYVPVGTSVTYNENTVTIDGYTRTATPNQGYRFKNWSDNFDNFVVNQDSQCIANFVEDVPEIELRWGVNPAPVFNYRAINAWFYVDPSDTPLTATIYNSTTGVTINNATIITHTFGDHNHYVLLGAPEAGEYTVTVTDNNGHTIETTGVVEPEPLPAFYIDCDNASVLANVGYDEGATWDERVTLREAINDSLVELIDGIEMETVSGHNIINLDGRPDGAIIVHNPTYMPPEGYTNATIRLVFGFDEGEYEIWEGDTYTQLTQGLSYQYNGPTELTISGGSTNVAVSLEGTDPCEDDPCSDPECPNYDPSECDPCSDPCNPECPEYDPCTCDPCNPECPERDPCECDGECPQEWAICETCGGSGLVEYEYTDRVPCETCGGYGYIQGSTAPQAYIDADHSTVTNYDGSTTNLSDYCDEHPDDLGRNSIVISWNEDWGNYPEDGEGNQITHIIPIVGGRGLDVIPDTIPYEGGAGESGESSRGIILSIYGQCDRIKYQSVYGVNPNPDPEEPCDGECVYTETDSGTINGSGALEVCGLDGIESPGINHDGGDGAIYLTANDGEGTNPFISMQGHITVMDPEPEPDPCEDPCSPSCPDRNPCECDPCDPECPDRDPCECDGECGEEYETMACPGCGGSGEMVSDEPCDACGGTGTIMCATCGGSGTMTCPDCGGTGHPSSGGEDNNSGGENSSGGGLFGPGTPGHIIEPDEDAGSDTWCTTCGGSGTITCDECGGAGNLGMCESCGGTGVIPSTYPCDQCNGAGEVAICPDCGGEPGNSECPICGGGGYFPFQGV